MPDRITVGEAVAAFLERQIGFSDIPRVIESTVRETASAHPESITKVLAADAEARQSAWDKINSLARSRPERSIQGRN